MLLKRFTLTFSGANLHIKDLSYNAVKKLIIFAEMQEKQANVFYFQRKNMR